MNVKAGEVFRDTYYDGKSPSQIYRKVRILEVRTDHVLAETFVRTNGTPVDGKPRKTLISFKTLQAGFERASD